MVAGRSGGSKWFRVYRQVPGAVPLFCFPHAGGAASYFHPWSAPLAPGIEVLAVQYPGREDRAAEPCVTNIADLADQIHAALGSSLPRRFAFFGHSMGAILAFEVARRISRQQGRGPAHLFVSGRAGPPRHHHRNLHRAGTAALIAELRSYGATDPRILDDSEILELIMPAVLADYTASETYQFEPGPPLSCDITAMTGDRDRLNTTGDAAGWSAHTTRAFTLRVYPGGHFYLDACRAQVLEVISSSLASSAAAGCLPGERGLWPGCRSGQVQQFAEYAGRDFVERPGFSLADPLREGDPEHRRAGLRRQGGRRLADASRAQGGGDRRGEARGLMLLAFLQCGILVDHGLSHAGVGAALVGEERCRRVQG